MLPHPFWTGDKGVFLFEPSQIVSVTLTGLDLFKIKHSLGNTNQASDCNVNRLVFRFSLAFFAWSGKILLI